MKIVKADGNTAPVRLRKEPDGQIITSIPQGAVADVLETEGNWSKVLINGTTGWMMNKFLYDQAPKSNLSELKTKLKEVLVLLDQLED